ncbi:MAG TPA: hypothetical protein VFL29_06090 [Candidatus Dormibacteraeota bacterium]|nr:hypothetical protein [Candidatus Dormibacteraeota bacterium]
MVGARYLAHFVALAGMAAVLAACGQTYGVRGLLPPAHTRVYPSQTATPLPAGVDALAALEQRPMRPPAPDASGVCWASSSPAIASVPNYGAGAGPLYLSGQDAWAAGGAAAILMIESNYSGPLLIRTFQLGGDGHSVMTMTGFATQISGFTDKEQAHGVTAVAADELPGGGLYFAAIPPASTWRASLGTLGSSGSGCFGMQIDGDRFTEFIVVDMNPGAAPPG